MGKLGVVGNKSLVQGVGINDAEYVVKPRNGEDCPFYRAWIRVLERCYCKKFKKSRPTYQDVVVCKEWLTFSNFKAWMETQDWRGKQLDKDLLLQGNKIYGPDSCIFISLELNTLLIDSAKLRGKYPLGVSYHVRVKTYAASISFKKKPTHLGYFSTPQEAHIAWQEKKKNIIFDCAVSQENEKIRNALLLRCTQLQYDIDNGLETIKL